MNNNYVELNLTKYPLKDTFVFPLHLCKSLTGPTYDYVNAEHISEELKDQLTDLGVEISGSVIFQKLPGYTNPLHTDVVIKDNRWEICHCAINWDLTGNESIMEWYNTSEKEIWPAVEETSLPYRLSGIHYGHLGNRDTSKETMSLIDSTRIVNPTLVRTDIPHQIKNLDNRDRWSLSIRFVKNYSWEEALEIFKSIIAA